MWESAEHDCIWMSLVIFLPTVFAVGLLFFPRHWVNGMRWWALSGTALTLAVSIGMFVLYERQVVEAHLGDRGAETNLQARADALVTNANLPERHYHDWIASYPWIQSFNINYFLGVDGISMALILLTTVLSFLAMIASWKIDRYVRGYCMLFLLLETGMLGTFLALDFFLFYIFWEVMLLPMYFLIGVWGGPRREYAAIKFFLYTLLGSVFILIALLAFYFTDVRDFDLKADSSEPSVGRREAGPVHTFDILTLQKAGREASRWLKVQNAPPDQREALEKEARQDLFQLLKQQEIANLPPIERERLLYSGTAEEKAKLDKDVTDLAQKKVDAALQRLQTQSFFNSPAFQYAMFLLLLVGFAIKVPVFPFHTWLPDAHVEAPTPISMILAGVLLKMGGYGILRIAYPICPWAAEMLAWWVALFGIINIVYGAFAAMAQTDFKKLVAYSSISHMGYVLLGIAVWPVIPGTSQFWNWGVTGAMFQMIAHGITSAGMFFLVGVVYDRAHHRNLDNFRGLYDPMPLYGGISAIIFFAAMGLPGMCGFVGEFMVVLATWNYSPLFAILAGLTVVITAAYILWTLQRVFLGVNPAYAKLPDIDLRELACIVPLVILSIALGVVPGLLLSWMGPTVTNLVQTLARVGP